MSFRFKWLECLNRLYFWRDDNTLGWRWKHEFTQNLLYNKCLPFSSWPDFSILFFVLFLRHFCLCSRNQLDFISNAIMWYVLWVPVENDIKCTCVHTYFYLLILFISFIAAIFAYIWSQVKFIVMAQRSRLFICQKSHNNTNCGQFWFNPKLFERCC